MEEKMVPELPKNVPGDRVVGFDIYAPPGSDRNAVTPWLQLQRSTTAEIVWSRENGGHWIVLNGSRIKELIADSDRLSNRLLTAPREMGEATQLIPLQTDEPEHKIYRNILSKEMGAKYLMELDQPIREIARTLTADLRDRGQCDFITDFCEIFPVHVFLLLVGLPREDAPLLRRLALQLGRPDGTMTPEEFMGALDAYLNPHIQNRLEHPGNDLLSRILSKPIVDRPWTFDEATRICRNLMLAGLDTVASLLGFAVEYLANHPEQQQLIRDNPDIIPAAADELIRRFPVVVLGREARRDFTLDGVQVKRSDIVILPTMLHNFDSASFDAPEEVRFDRPLSPHCTMGNGIHRCVGAGLARLELITFLEVWHTLIPSYRIDQARKTESKGGTIITLLHLPLIWDQ